MVDERQVKAACHALLEAVPPASTPAREQLAARYDAGLAWVHLPEGHGGLSAPPALNSVVAEMLRPAGAADPWSTSPVGFGTVGPTLVAHGDERQRALARAAFTGEDQWCQMFSEPGAGSDLAGISTRARRAGDGWVVNGAKVWITMAHVARYGYLLARTDPSVPKHRGLTAFMIDMAAPGISISPIMQATGEAEFNEVVLEDVRVEDSARIGAVGGGWTVARTTLMNERYVLAADLPTLDQGSVADLLQAWRRHPGDVATLDAVCEIVARAEGIRALGDELRDAERAGTPGPAGSFLKLALSRLAKDVTDLHLELLGPAGQRHPGGYPFTRTDEVSWGTGSDPVHAYLRALPNTVEGGTSEIQLNIIGEQVLGLPTEPRTDKDVPWRDVPRG